ncbi:MAG TPA: PH domain-containing protein [Anaerolineae bacterium]|nr:PH domain-containing protein [Anaerolineae bacterium]
MGYVEQLLSKDEAIIVRSRQHWIALIASALVNGFIIIVAMVLRIVVGNALISLPQIIADGLTLVTLLIVLFAAVRFVWNVLQWWAEEYIVTTRRVIQTEGIINKRTTDSSLEKVNDVVLVQSFFGRILGYGDLEIVTGSDIGVNKLNRLRDPISFKTAMLDQKAQLGGEYGERTPDTSSDRDVPKLIADLDELRRRGLLSDAEFNEKKAQLLSQL